MKTRLSIVVPSYNQGSFIRSTLESLTDQRNLSPGELEIIVMDGGSTDNSVEIIKEFAPHLSYWVSQKDGGQSRALNLGFQRASGNIQGWLCSDDLLEPDTVRTVIDTFDKYPKLGFLFGDSMWIDREGKRIRAKKEIPFNWFIYKYDHDYIPQPSTFWRANLFRQVGGINEQLQLSMDADLWARFAVISPPKHIAKQLSSMRLYPEQKTSANRVESYREFRAIVSRYGATFDDSLRARASGLAARGMRCAWKLASGCYW